MHIQSKRLWTKFVVGPNSDLGQPFRSRQKEEGRLFHYDIRAERALPPSITVIARV